MVLEKRGQLVDQNVSRNVSFKIRIFLELGFTYFSIFSILSGMFPNRNLPETFCQLFFRHVHRFFTCTMISYIQKIEVSQLPKTFQGTLLEIIIIFLELGFIYLWSQFYQQCFIIEIHQKHFLSIIFPARTSIFLQNVEIESKAM